MHCRMFSSTPGLHPLALSNTSPVVRREKSPVDENHWSNTPSLPPTWSTDLIGFSVSAFAPSWVYSAHRSQGDPGLKKKTNPSWTLSPLIWNFPVILAILFQVKTKVVTSTWRNYMTHPIVVGFFPTSFITTPTTTTTALTFLLCEHFEHGLLSGTL